MGSSESDSPPVLRWARDAVTAIIAVGALGGSIIGLWKEAGSQQNQYLVGGLGLLAVGAVWYLQRLLRRRFAPGSYLRKPSALDIGRRYLYGRDTDVENLLGRLADHPLVWLVGESGAGKSSLLERGLVPRLRDAPSFFPLYLDHWGADWIEGPRQGLRRALQEALDEELRRKLKIEGPVDADLAVALLRRFPDELGLTPILIFDQFDDYQTRHRDRFLHGPERKVLSVKRLVAQNLLWKEVAELLEQGKAGCVFVTRTDMQWGLECVRFREPEVYVLGRLGRTYAAELLDEIIAGDGVAAPERGWQGLRERFMDDLGADGWVLPIRMKFAFRGLAGLRPLSVIGYEREGGLTGLEALDVKRHVVEATRQVSWPEGHVRRLLLELVEPESRSKTVAKTPEDLARLLPEADRDANKLDQVLRTLADADILRQRIDPDQEGEVVWLLYHDYLCDGVLELDRRARRWQLLLDEAARAFEGARGLSKWKALLRPVDQIRLLGARLRGQVRYGGARGYAAVSGVRWVVNVWVVILFVGFFVWRDVSAEREAQDLFNRITLEYRITEDERAALWSFSGGREIVKKAYFSIVFSHPTNVDRFLGKAALDSGFPGGAPYIVHSALGLKRSLRCKLLVQVIDKHCYRNPAVNYSTACSHLLAELPRVPETEGAAVVIAGRILDLMVGTQASDQLSALSRDLGALEWKLTADAAETAAGRIVEVMAATRNLDQLLVLSEGLKALGEKLPDDAAERDKLPDDAAETAAGRPDDAAETAAGRIVEVMAGTQDPDRLSELSQVLGTLGEKLPDNAAESAASRIIDVMAGTPAYWSESFPLLIGLGALGEKLPEDAAKAGFGRTVELMADTKTTFQSSQMSETLDALAKKLPDDAAESTFNQIVDLMAGNQNPYQLDNLAEGLEALGEKLPADAAETAAGRIVELMASTQNPAQLSFLSRGLGALGQKLSDDSVGKSVQSLLSALYPIPQPPCASAASLIRKDNLQPIVELLKWPTCSPEDRNQLIEKIGEVTGESFGREVDGEFQADLWTFIEWAAENGYDTDSPPRPP